MFCKLLMVVCAVLVSANAKHIKGIQIKNRGHERLWVEMTDEEGFVLPPGQLASIVVEEHWSGRIWAQREECKNKQCNSPYTVAELKFQGEEGQDRYYISLIEGFNRPIKIQPTSLNHNCKSALCHANINHHCPSTHKVHNNDGVVVACKPSPELFQKLCPEAITSEDDVASNTFTCRSNTYLVLIG